MGADTFNVVITGANKGIGRVLVEEYLSRHNTTVIAAVRDLGSAARAFESLSVGAKRSLILVKIDSMSETDAHDAVEALQKTYGIGMIDLLIANAGMGNAYDAAASTPLNSLTTHFLVNAGGPLLLFQAFRPLLLAASESSGHSMPKFVVLSSAIASLTQTGQFPLKSTAYGASKTAVNFITQRINAEEEWLITFPISPGWVQTTMGDTAAGVVGMSQAPLTAHQSVSGIMRVIDGAKRSEAAERFVDYDGNTIPW
ncbi:hypothetical protein LTR84_008649 [Exophiala bonariae]|uniref:Uncharacterized protein n=1 Tax=Exophiala bonariae TaxID=1690606 RepID=A0AAV9MZM9_9EURO|nr:hypothetical protein LTR84_008649 [Exophiala bonariae]